MTQSTVKTATGTFTIQTANAMGTFAALNVLVKHLAALEPVLKQLVAMFGQKKPGSDPIGLVMLVAEAFQLVTEKDPHDVFLFVSLLSGIEQEKLEKMPFADFWAIVKAVGAANDLAALIRMGHDLRN